MSSFESKLEEILNQDVSSVVNAQRAALEQLLAETGECYVLFGAGRLGQVTLSGLRRAGIEPVAFADNNPKLWNTTINGVRVFSPQEAADQFKQKAIFVITVYTSQPVWQQLTGLGVKVLSFAALARHHPAVLTPHGGVELPYKLFEEADQVRNALFLWADDASRREYLGQLNWQATLDLSALPPHLPPDQIYFADELINPLFDEVFVDCGGFDGDTLQEFINRRGEAFANIVAIEPDPANCEALKARVSKLPGESRSRIHIIQSAVGSKHEVVTFNATGTAGSSIGEGSYQVQCAPLDELLEGINPTFIKMDIEGAEPDALLGAGQIIEKNTPVLAICLYHAQEHLWQIPLFIHSICDKYDFFLRRYSDECWELVCYAVPKTRRPA